VFFAYKIGVNISTYGALLMRLTTEVYKIYIITLFDRFKGYMDRSACKWNQFGKITNCGDYFVYYLKDLIYHCDLTYCATDD
jgi:hypothetical protein